MHTKYISLGAHTDFAFHLRCAFEMTRYDAEMYQMCMCMCTFKHLDLLHIFFYGCGKNAAKSYV